MVFLREWGYYRWLGFLEKQDQAILTTTPAEAPNKTWEGYYFDDRGVRIKCPEAEKSCGVMGRARPGDRLTVQGSVNNEIQEISKGQKVSGIERGNQVLSKRTKIIFQTSKVLRYELVQPTPIISYWWWVRVMEEVRIMIETYYKTVLGEPYAGLLSGIVLGTQTQMSEELYLALARTGTMHVVAASGFNITLVAGALMGVLLLWLPRKTASWGTMLGILGYVLLSGAGPSVMRAGIMGGLALTAQTWGRPYTAKWALIITALLMLILWPWLLTSVSFQLSVAATAGLVWGERKIRKVLKAIKVPSLAKAKKGQSINLKKESNGTQNPLIEGVGKDLSTTTAATLATLPITAVTFGQISLIAPLVNVLVLWLVPPIMVLGGASAILSFIWAPLGQIAVWLAWPLLYTFVVLVEGFGQISWALLTVRGLSWWWGIGWWCLLAAWWGIDRAESPDKPNQLNHGKSSISRQVPLDHYR
jgi:ComEC/Rec2-related protein